MAKAGTSNKNKNMIIITMIMLLWSLHGWYKAHTRYSIRPITYIREGEGVGGGEFCPVEKGARVCMPDKRDYVILRTLLPVQTICYLAFPVV